MNYTVYWRFYSCTEWVAEEVWARSYEDARSKILNSNHMIQVTEGYYDTDK